mmetsp:Transcript_30364/g.84891  ORF Transcript_30364/g.84891 Transcript_30364/m.84891 type:complete len:228 (-) Transcript_30364:1350-2033(-)
MACNTGVSEPLHPLSSRHRMSMHSRCSTSSVALLSDFLDMLYSRSASMKTKCVRLLPDASPDARIARVCSSTSVGLGIISAAAPSGSWRSPPPNDTSRARASASSLTSPASSRTAWDWSSIARSTAASRLEPGVCLAASSAWRTVNPISTSSCMRPPWDPRFRSRTVREGSSSICIPSLMLENTASKVPKCSSEQDKAPFSCHRGRTAERICWFSCFKNWEASLSLC